MGSVPYEQVQKKMAQSDITIIVEGFKKEDINLSRYSLSTKAADALASGAAIFVYGSLESGIIEYMKSTQAAAVCTRKEDLTACLTSFLQDEHRQKNYYDQAIVMTEKHHNRPVSCALSEQVIGQAISNFQQRKGSFQHDE